MAVGYVKVALELLSRGLEAFNTWFGRKNAPDMVQHANTAEEQKKKDEINKALADEDPEKAKKLGAE